MSPAPSGRRPIVPAVIVAASLLGARLAAGADPSGAARPPTARPDAPAPLDPLKAAADATAALADRASRIGGTWTVQFRSGDRPAGQWVLAVQGGAWSLSPVFGPTTKPATQPALAATASPKPWFYGDGRYVYDLRSLERYGYGTAQSRLPDAGLLRLVLANVQPAAILAALGKPTAAAEEPPATGGGRLLRLRFEAQRAGDKGKATVIQRSRPAIDVLIDRENAAIVAIRDIDLMAGVGSACRASTGGDGLPAKVDEEPIQEDAAGRFAPAANAAPTFKVDLHSEASPSGHDAVADAVAQVKATPFFATPRDALEPVAACRAAVAADPGDLSAAAALATATFAGGDLLGGLAQWDALDAHLKDDASRGRLTGVIGPVAAEAAWFAADDKEHAAAKAPAAVAIVRKVRTAADDAQWRFVAPSVLFAWEGLRGQPGLADADRQELDGAVLPRLCTSGNVSVVAQLIQLAAKAAALKPIVDRDLDAAAGSAVPGSAYANSTLSTLVAAAVSSVQPERAVAWLATAKQGGTFAVPASIGAGIDLGSRLKAGDLAQLGPAIECYTSLDAGYLGRDASAAAARAWLLSCAASALAAGNGGTDPIKPTASLGGADAFWDRLIESQVAAHRAVVGDDSVLKLAASYAAAFKQPAYVSRTLIRIADRDRLMPSRQMARRQRLEASVAAATDDQTRVTAIVRLAGLYVDLGEPLAARAQLAGIREKVTGKGPLEVLDAAAHGLAKQCDLARHRASMTQRQADPQLRLGTLDFIREEVVRAEQAGRPPADLAALHKLDAAER
jgi:hypothetical protein